jgi:hypothetical protein
MTHELHACSARKEKGTSKLKLFRKSAVKLADDLGRKSGYRGPAGVKACNLSLDGHRY